MKTLAGLLMLLGGCDELLIQRQDPGNHYVRPAFECPCVGTDCKCNHCSKVERGAKCYCSSGGCACGRQGPCKCKHCTGVAGGCDGKNNCDCRK